MIGGEDEGVDRVHLTQTLREWVRRGQYVGEALTCIRLTHDNRRDPIDTIFARDIPDWQQADGDKTDGLSARIANALEKDAAQFKGSHETYYVFAYHGGLESSSGGSGKSSAHLCFELSMNSTSKERKGRGNQSGEERALETLSGLLKGTLVPTLTHNAGELSRQTKVIERLERRVDTLLNENQVLRFRMDEMQTQKELREQNAEAAKENREFRRELYKDLKTLAPVIVNRMAGEKLMPEAELAPEQIMLRQMVRELDGDEVGFVIDVMIQKHPRLALMIAELVKSVQGEDVRRLGVSAAVQKVLDAEAKKKAEDEARTKAASKIPEAPERPILPRDVA